MTSPCYGCERRNERCHGHCEQYLAWKKAKEDEKKPPVYLYTAAHKEKIKRTLRDTMKNRADRRGAGHGGE